MGTNFEHSSNRIEEPAMGVDLLLVFRLDDQDDLNGDQVKRVIALRKYKLGLSVDGKLSGVLKSMQR